MKAADLTSRASQPVRNEADRAAFRLQLSRVDEVREIPGRRQGVGCVAWVDGADLEVVGSRLQVVAGVDKLDAARLGGDGMGPGERVPGSSGLAHGRFG
jgi:isopentenyl diphosphate isomerase/L-lactate dehydrogenase-like FMN-dependent dehydrogenase